MNYKIYDGDWQSNYCVLENIENFEDDYKLTRGDSLTGNWPDDVQFKMDRDFPRQLKLSDHLLNPENLMIGSKSLCQFLRQEKVKNLEFLPVKIIDHKKRVASLDYHIVHLIHPQDCIDVAKSGVTWNHINPDWITAVQQLVIDESRIDSDIQLFRAKHLRRAIFIRHDLAEKIEKAGFTCIDCYDIDDFE